MEKKILFQFYQIIIIVFNAFPCIVRIFLLLYKEIFNTIEVSISLLNALFLDDLLLALKNNGWELIDARQAFTDDVFIKQPLITPCGESIVWQCARLDKKLLKSLRYPAEDGEYEIEPLKLFIKQYETMHQPRKTNRQ